MTALIAVVLVAFIILALWANQDSKPATPKKYVPRLSKRAIAAKQTSKLKQASRPSFKASSAMVAKLVNALNGDKAAANRLIASIQGKYPDKSADWHYEKAIADLERDRRV